MRVLAHIPGSPARSALCLTFTIAVISISAPADTITLNPIKDNTLIEPVAIAPNNSNALGSIFSGRLGSNGNFAKLRCVLAFDLTGPGGVPPGATINSASLVLRLERAHGGAQTHTLHRLLANWGEGTSAGGGGAGGPTTVNDATWVHRFYSTQLWATPGGDFIATASASQVVNSSFIDHTWTSPQLAADVQAWVDSPSSNFGWLMRGNETSTIGTAKKFYSRETITPEVRPRLIINFTPGGGPPCPADVNNTGAVDADDLVMVVLQWGACASCPATPCPADTDGNCTVDADDLTAVVLNWGACP